MNVDLNFDIAWELTPPADGTFINSKIPSEAMEQFFLLLTKAANRTTDAEEVYYLIRAGFSEATGHPIYRSTSMYFAPGDARTAMERAMDNAPVFISAYYSVCKTIKKQFGTKSAPSIPDINRLLELHRLGYVIEPPNLVLRDQVEVIPVQSPNILEQFQARFRMTIDRSQQLLEENKGDEAVAQIWWLLESITLLFAGTRVNGEAVTGTYFNEVTRSLRKAASNKPNLGAVTRWLEALQSHLSGPNDAGIRHGRPLHLEGLKRHEAELFCNLTRSYISYLLAEYEANTSEQQDR